MIDSKHRNAPTARANQTRVEAATFLTKVGFLKITQVPAGTGREAELVFRLRLVRLPSRGWRACALVPNGNQ
jgi:hypothetical protein